MPSSFDAERNQKDWSRHQPFGLPGAVLDTAPTMMRAAGSYGGICTPKTMAAPVDRAFAAWRDPALFGVEYPGAIASKPRDLE